MKKNTLIHPTAAMVKTEHNLSFIWNFIPLNQPLSSCFPNKLIFQWAFPCSPGLENPHPGQSGTLPQRSNVQTSNQLGHNPGCTGRKKTGSGGGGCSPLSPFRQSQGVSLGTKFSARKILLSRSVRLMYLHSAHSLKCVAHVECILVSFTHQAFIRSFGKSWRPEWCLLYFQ